MASASGVLLLYLFLLLVITYETKGYDALIGEACEVDRNCISSQMICNPGRVCECMRGHYPSEDRRGCIATTSGLCFEASDCNTLPSSSCFILDQFEGTCTCNDAYTSSEDERECLPDASFHGSCREAVQCVSRLGFYAVCREGQCECQNNYHYSITEERCIGDVGLLGPCVNTSQCVTRGEQNAVVCLDGRCSCSQGYEQFQDYCRAGAHKAVLAGTTFFLYWIIKAVITSTTSTNTTRRFVHKSHQTEPVHNGIIFRRHYNDH